MHKPSDIDVLHTLLREGHAEINGPVLEGEVVNSRIFTYREGSDAVTVWGADYEPTTWLAGRLVVPLFCRWKDDLGLPAAVPQDGWLSQAEATDKGAIITQFRYSTDAWRWVGSPVLSMRSGHVSCSLAELGAYDLSGSSVTLSPSTDACMEPARPLATEDTERLICMLASVHEVMTPLPMKHLSRPVAAP